MEFFEVSPTQEEEIEEACYGSDMLDCFETQISQNIISVLCPTVPTTSFILFPHLPVEIQREIWFQALPPPQFLRLEFNKRLTADGVEINLSLDQFNLISQFHEAVSSSSYQIQPSCYLSREVFLENYSRLNFVGENAGQKFREYSDWDDSFQEVEVVGRPGPLFNMRSDNLYIINLYSAISNLKRFEMSIDFTALRYLIVDKFNIDLMEDAQAMSNSFWMNAETFLPSLERLSIILNTSDARIYPIPAGYTGVPIDTQLLAFSPTLIEKLRQNQWMGQYVHASNFDLDSWHSSKECQSIYMEIGKQWGYWKKIHLKPVWMVYIVPFYTKSKSKDRILGPFMVVKTRYSVPIHMRCNMDGTLPDQYDRIKELFGEENPI